MLLRNNELKARLRQSVAAGSAVFLSSGVAAESDTDSEFLGSTDSVSWTQETDPHQDGEVASYTHELPQPGIEITIPDEFDEVWTMHDLKRFKALAICRALGKATAEEHQEFKRLQKRRRIAEDNSSSDEILAECTRRRFYNEMLEVLTRNVRFLQPEDQKKIGSLRENY